MGSVAQDGANDFNAQGILLIQRALDGFDESYGAGSMSCAIYDTAWVSLVTKTVEGQEQWLFPVCFQYLLDMQSTDGGWEQDSGSQIDGILNTASALLALIKHYAEPLNIQNATQEDLRGRITRATTSLKSQLESWDVSATKHVGFEIIVPALLFYLEANDSKLVFDFKGRPALEKINAIKLSRFKPEYLYGSVKVTALHSLEAFIGKIDFDKVAHHKVQGAMMASPSSTVAYLMNASKWDNEAETYLRQVIRTGAGRGSGGVPSAYPSMHFEYTWILSTLFRAGFTSADLDCPELGKMKEILSDAFRNEDGVIGFAPSVGADVDDTAKGIISLNELGNNIDPEKMVEVFEGKAHFKTYSLERDPSFSANCNALLALLHRPNVLRFGGQIVKIVKFLCDYWWKSNGSITDKWNLCQLYPCLLIVEAMTDVLALVEQGGLKLDQSLQSEIAITLCQACLRPLLTQKDNGSWNDSTEETAYAVLTLSEARRVCFLDNLQQTIESALRRGREFLQSGCGGQKLNRIWIEKVTYAVVLLTDCYVLAALKASSSPTRAKVASSLYSTGWALKTSQMVKLFKLTPLFSDVPEWQLQASMIEATLFQPLLRSRRLEIFPRKNMEEDKYFDIIPFTWTACNNKSNTFASTLFIYEMMVISFLNYQADEFMEAVAGRVFEGRTAELRRLIDRAFVSESDRVDEDDNAKNCESEDVFAKESHQVNGNHPNGSGHVENGHRGKSRYLKELEAKSYQVNGNSRHGYSHNQNGHVQIGHTGKSRYLKDLETRARETDSNQTKRLGNGEGNGHINKADYHEVFDPLSKFVAHVCNHPGVLGASAWDREMVKRDLRIFLHAHVTQTEDNAAFTTWQKSSSRGTFSTAKEPFFQWVRTTSADHTSCPYSFSFVSCLLSALNDGVECFPSVGEKYLAAATCRHLATMCRMYNDYGSVARDMAEKNLNSIDFPEFELGGAKKSGEDNDSKDERKNALFQLAEYERSCMEEARRRLGLEPRTSDKAKAKERQMKLWYMFCDVTDLYGQIYVVKDIASRMIVAASSEK